MKSMDLYRAFGGIDDALLEQSEALGEASFKEVRVSRAGQWIRKHASLVALLAVCVAVGSFLTFGGGMRGMGSSKSAEAPSTPASAPALASAPASPAPTYSAAGQSSAEEAPESAEFETDNGTVKLSNDATSFGQDVIPRLEDLEYGGINYILAGGSEYTSGEYLGEEIDGWDVYSVEGRETGEMIALCDPATGREFFYKAVQ